MRARAFPERYAHLPWLIIAMTVVALAIGTVAARYVENHLVASKGESLALAAAEIANKLDILLAEQYDDTLEFSRTQVFRKHGVAAQSAYLETVKKIHPIYLWLGVTDARGRIVAATGPASIGQDRSRSPWFQAARDTGSVHMSDVEPFVEAGGIDAISFTAPIEGADGKFLGVVTTRIGLPVLEEVVARTLRAFQAREDFGGTLEYRFLTSSGNVFIDSDLLHKGNVNLKRLGVTSARLSESGRPGYVEEEHLQRHVRVVTGYAVTQGSGQFAGPQWAVLLRMDKDDLVAPVRSVLRKLAAAWVLVWVPMLGFLFWSTTRLKKEWAHAQEEQVHAETAESSYRLLVEQARDIIYRTDAQGRFTFVNPVVTRLMGYAPEELLGRRFVELIRPDVREAAERFYGRQFVRKTLNTYYEFPAVSKDGREIWFGQNVQVLLEDDRVIGFHAVTRDITDRKRAEEELRESERRLALVLKATNEGLWDWNVKTGAVYYSPHWIESLGYAPEEVSPHVKFWESIVHPDDMPRVREALQAHFERRTPIYECENRLRRKDGSWRWNLDRGQVVEWDSNGTPLRMVGTDTDITERKRVEEKLLLSREIIANANDPISVMDLQGRFTYQNSSHASLVGYVDDELLGKTPALFLGDDAFTSICQELARTQSFRGEVTARKKDGTTKELDLSVFTIRDAANRPSCFVAIKRDVTDRKEAETRQLALLAELGQAKEHFETVFKTTPTAIAISTLDEGRFVNVNDAFTELTGYSQKELVGHTTLGLNLWADPSARAHIMQEIRERGYLRNKEGRLRTKAGEIRDMVVSVERIQVGAAPCLIYIAHDITDRKREEQLLQALLEGTASVTGEQFFPALVRALARTLGVRHALVTELLDGERPRLRMLAIWMGDRLGSPTEYALVRTPCEKVVQLGEAYYQHSVQDLFPEDKDLVALGAVSYLGMALMSSSGNTIGHLCILDDKPLPDAHRITPLIKIFASRAAAELERKQAEEVRGRLVTELAESRNRFEMFFRQTPSAISITTVKEGRFLDVNKQAEILTGYSRAELIGRTTVDMHLYVEPTDRPELVAQLKEKGVLTDLERQIRTKSGEIRTAVFSLVPIQTGAEPCILSIAHDITDRKRAESFLAGEKQALEIITSGATLPTVLESIVRLVEEQRPGMLCSILLLDKGGKTLRHGAAPSLPPSYIQAVDGIAIGPNAGSCGTAAFLGQTVIAFDISSDPLWTACRDLALPHGLRACWSMPIFSSDRLVLGTFAQYHRTPRSPTDDDLRLVERASHLAGIAIERARAEEVLREANLSLRMLSRQLLRVQEDDRRAIARDLHDEIGQSLTAIKLNVERAKRTSEHAARDRIMRDCIQITDGVLNQVRNLSLDLHPSILDDLGLAYALKWYADRQAERAGLKIEVAADASLPRLPHEVEIACFRIAQEALTNVVRHAKARRTTVTLNQGTMSVELRVQDDGTGFVVHGTSPLDGEASVGLASMQERARLLGGEVRITSRLGHGTEVVALLPLDAPVDPPVQEVSPS